MSARALVRRRTAQTDLEARSPKRRTPPPTPACRVHDGLVEAVVGLSVHADRPAVWPCSPRAARNDCRAHAVLDGSVGHSPRVTDIAVPFIRDHGANIGASDAHRLISQISEGSRAAARCWPSRGLRGAGGWRAERRWHEPDAPTHVTTHGRKCRTSVHDHLKGLLEEVAPYDASGCRCRRLTR